MFYLFPVASLCETPLYSDSKTYWPIFTTELDFEWCGFDQQVAVEPFNDPFILSPLGMIDSGMLDGERSLLATFSAC